LPWADLDGDFSTFIRLYRLAHWPHCFTEGVSFKDVSWLIGRWASASLLPCHRRVSSQPPLSP